MEDAFDPADVDPAQEGHTFNTGDNAFADRRCGESGVNVFFCWGGVFEGCVLVKRTPIISRPFSLIFRVFGWRLPVKGPDV